MRDDFTFEGVWDRRVLGHSHKALKGTYRANFSHAAPRRARAPQPHSVDRTVSDFLPEQARLNILRWNPGPRRGTSGAIEQHNAGAWHIVALPQSSEFC